MTNRLKELTFMLLVRALIVSLGLSASAAYGEGSAVLKGRITDVEGRAVEAAKVFAYDDAEVRRAGDFISPPSDKDGKFRMVLLPGKYWLVARLKKGEEYGPLMPGDRHSGDPVIVNVAPGQEIEQNFTVVDLKEARKMRARDQEVPFKISGRITDEKGAPVTRAYAFALKSESMADIPDYISAWVDSEGRYTIHLPKGRYFVGSAAVFPPGQRYSISGAVMVDSDKSGIDIVLKSGDIR